MSGARPKEDRPCRVPSLQGRSFHSVPALVLSRATPGCATGRSTHVKRTGGAAKGSIPNADNAAQPAGNPDLHLPEKYANPTLETGGTCVFGGS